MTGPDRTGSDRAHLGRAGKPEGLSGGEQARLGIARPIAARPPTVEKAPGLWRGALVVVSHDRLLRRRFTGDIRRTESGQLLE
ncbi:hypothetical protein ACFCZT_01255 [Streptomyces sp. NPDC056230]|uniref:hypothetical protein n=1 Tax=Streptomyces sp. NPDC056230 TaxID=3345754 RepID=UPI0035D7471C